MGSSSNIFSPSQNIHSIVKEMAPLILALNNECPEELKTALIDISNVLFSMDENSLDKNQINQLKRALETIKKYIRVCRGILYEPHEVSPKSEIYLNILPMLDCHFQAEKQALKTERKAFRKALKSKEQELAKKEEEEKEENIREEKQPLETEEKELKSWEQELKLKEKQLIAEKKAFIEAFLEELIKLQKYTVELKRRRLWKLCKLTVEQIPVPCVIEDATIFVPPEKEPWLISDPKKLSADLRLRDAFNIIATVRFRLQENELYDNYVSELNKAIGVIQKYRLQRLDLQDQIPFWQEGENYAEKLRSALFQLREITKEVPKVNHRCPVVLSNAPERGQSFFESKPEVKNDKSSNLENPLVNADLTVQLLRENERKKESRIGKFIRKHPVKAAAIIIFGCLTILCVGAGIGLLSSGIGLGIAAGIGAAGISLLSVGPVYPVVLGGAYCVYKAYYNHLKKQVADDDGAYFRPVPP